jgi:hypothetical protein
MSAYCANCAEALDLPGGRLPPWCPKCGADVTKDTLSAPAPAPRQPDRPAAPAAGISPTPGRSAQLSTGANTAPKSAASFDESQPLAAFDFSRRGYVETVGAGLLLAGILAVIAAGGFALEFARPNANTTLPALLMAGLAVGALAFTFAKHGKRIHRVEVFAGGVRWLGPDGVGRLAWADVETVYRFDVVINGFPKSELKLVTKSGREVVFDRTLDRYQEMMGLIQSRCAELMRPRKRQEAGACGAEFGPLLVGPAGVSTDGWLVPWESVERYSVSGGRLWIEFVGRGRKAIPLSTIPNYLVLLYLLGEFAPPQVREASGLPATAD